MLLNIWKFLIKQRRYRNQQLVVYYTLCTFVIAARIYQTIWYFKAAFLAQPIGLAAPPIFKSMLGVEQTWIMLELCMRIHTSNKALQLQIDKSIDATYLIQFQKSVALTEKSLRIGHYIVIVFIVSFIIGALTKLGLYGARNDVDELAAN